MDLLLDIPSVLASEIVGKWLYLKDVTHLDTAYCHTSKRQILHESVFQAPQCVVENVFELAVWNRKRYGWINPSPFDKSTFKWCAKRCLKLKDLHFTAKSDCHVMNAYLQVHGHSVRSALYKNDEFVKDASHDGTEDDSEDGTEDKSFVAQLQVVTRCCPHLTSFELSGGFVSLHAIQQMHMNTKLSSISATEVAVVESEVVAVDQATPLQCTTILLHCCYENCEDMILNLYSPKLVQKLSLSYTHDLDWSTFTNLRALQWQCYVNHHTALIIFSHCKNITHLHCGFRDESALVVAVTQLHRITSINLEKDSLKALTDHALYNLAQRHSDSLQALYIYQFPHRANPLSSAAINAFLSRCTRIRTLSFNHVDGIDYSLLKNITTLTTDCPRPVAAWREIIHHCTSLATFNMMHTVQPIPVGAVMRDGINVDADQLHFNRYHCVKRDMQWSTHLIVIAARMLTTLKTIVYYQGYMTGELRTALHKQAPTVRVVQGTGREWYNFSKLSIDD